MRAQFVLAILMGLICGPAAAQSAPDDYLGLPGPIAFQDEVYALAWSSRPSDSYFKHEYLPDGQDVRRYTDMFLVEAVLGTLTPMEAAAAQVQSLEQRRGQDPVVNFNMIRNDATGEVLLDFVVSDLSVDPILVEWNAYRYAALEQGGVVLFGISRRGYGEDGAKVLLEGLGGFRQSQIDALANYVLPMVSLSN